MDRERAKELLPVIQAFAEGKDIECKSSLSDGWCNASNPAWRENWEYRVKPEPVKSSGYRRFLWKAPTLVEVGIRYENEQAGIPGLMNDSRFIRWIDTEWQYHEVESL